MATSVPVPIAMPTSAAAKAGASLTPSPAMATTGLPAQALDHLALFLGQHLGLDLGYSELASNGIGGRSIIPGQHHDANAVSLERGQRFGRGGFDRIGDPATPRCGRRWR